MSVEARSNRFTRFVFVLEQEGILEDGDDFAGFRLRVSELVKDVVFIVGSASVFKHCFLCIHGQSQMAWESTEASLFIMQAVAKNILPSVCFC
jgi:transportin-3